MVRIYKRYCKNCKSTHTKPTGRNCTRMQHQHDSVPPTMTTTTMADSVAWSTATTTTVTATMDGLQAASQVAVSPGNHMPSPQQPSHVRPLGPGPRLQTPGHVGEPTVEHRPSAVAPHGATSWHADIYASSSTITPRRARCCHQNDDARPTAARSSTLHACRARCCPQNDDARPTAARSSTLHACRARCCPQNDDARPTAARSSTFHACRACCCPQSAHARPTAARPSTFHACRTHCCPQSAHARPTAAHTCRASYRPPDTTVKPSAAGVCAAHCWPQLTCPRPSATRTARPTCRHQDTHNRPSAASTRNARCCEPRTTCAGPPPTIPPTAGLALPTIAAVPPAPPGRIPSAASIPTPTSTGPHSGFASHHHYPGPGVRQAHITGAVADSTPICHAISRSCHGGNIGWWGTPATGIPARVQHIVGLWQWGP